MNSQIFVCLPLAWGLWNNNVIYKQVFGTFERFWMECRRQIYCGLKEGLVLNPIFSKNCTDITWFKPEPPKPFRFSKRDKMTFDELLVDVIEGDKFMEQHEYEKSINAKWEKIPSTLKNLSGKEIYYEYQNERLNKCGFFTANRVRKDAEELRWMGSLERKQVEIYAHEASI